MTIVERLKCNTEAFGLMPEDLRRVAEEIGHDNFLVYDDDDWEKSGPGKMFPPLGAYLTYRLRKDYVCHHPHTREQTIKGLHACDWCDVCVEPPKPEMGWVEYEIFVGSGEYLFTGHNGKMEMPLKWAPGMVGFGGIVYKSPCACIPEDTCFYMLPAHPCEKHGPAVPVAVRFWAVKR